MKSKQRFAWVFASALLAGAPQLSAIVPPDHRGIPEYRDPRLDVPVSYQPLSALDGAVAALAEADLAALGVAPENGLLEVHSGGWGTLMDLGPLVPGSGLGNTLSWEVLRGSAPHGEGELRGAIWEVFARFLQVNAGPLRIDPREVARGLVTVQEAGALAQIYAPRVVEGVRVRDAALTAAINHGNLVLLGATRWGDLRVSSTPSVSAQEAAAAVAEHLAGLPSVERKAPYLEFVPLAADRGYDYRLAWVLALRVPGDGGSWEGLVDAHSGELLAFLDLNHYATKRRVQGGVYPVSNDGVVPDGVEQAGWPMPWADVTVGAETLFTDGGGNLGVCADGSITTHLDGLFVSIADVCGAVNESSAGNIDLGTSGGDDCTVPPGHSAGDTHSARSQFFEVSQIKHQGRGYLPENVWLQDQLTSNTNINQSCNAFWDGSTINFYRSGGNCANTGELQGVVDHEWGHGMDNNGAAPSISNPGEGIPDVYAALRLDNSCIGRGFIANGANCGGYGDPCTMCDGIREIDWAKHVSGQPHDIDWGQAFCGGVSHCLGHIYSEAHWDLYTRDLPAEYGFDAKTALEVTTHLTYLGASNVVNWFSTAANCETTTGCGCNADGGYLNYLAADDDDGNLDNGTPHMQAIFAAYDRHQIACTTPTVQDSGCAATPLATIISAVNPLDKGAQVVFDSQPGGGAASKFEIFRTDGVLGCDMGKVKVGEVLGPFTDGATATFTDEGLQNGREYRYAVVGVGSNPSCRSEVSNCVAATPTDGPNLSIDTSAADAELQLGDGDPFLDNCEEATITFDIANNGTGALHNVEIVDVEPLSHPNTVVSGTAVTGGATLGQCNTAQGRFNFQPRDMGFDETLVFRVDVTADELVVVKSALVSVVHGESDLEAQASVLFDFETDTDGWTVVRGTFNRTDEGGGGNGTDWYEASSEFLDVQCDQIRSPIVVLENNSTMSLWNQFNIEPFSAGQWYDRANIGVYDLEADALTVVSPSGGVLYNASGNAATNFCTDEQPGWADDSLNWMQSTWNSAALMAGTFADKLVQIQASYGTDPAANGFGLHFDEVTLTNISLQVQDGQSDVCEDPIFLFADGFESGDTSAWSSVIAN